MVEWGRRVKVHYTGKLDDGTVFDSSVQRGEPLEFVVGSHQVLPGFSRAISRMGIGEKRTVRLSSSEAYGVYDESLIEAIDARDIPEADRLPIGEYVTFSSPSGVLRVKVLKIEGDKVFFDHNHEFAGKDLTFTLELISVYGDYESAIEREKHPAGCACGCDKLKKALDC